MAATKLAVLFTLLYVVNKIQMITAQAICGGGCSGYGICGGVYPTIVDNIDNNDPLDIILPVLLLAICNRAGGNGPVSSNALNIGMTETMVASTNGCCGGLSGGYNGGCGGSCNGACNGCCNGIGCTNTLVAEKSAGLSNPCCGNCGCC